MSFHPHSESAHPLKNKSIKQPPVQPASPCARCLREGVADPDRRVGNVSGSGSAGQARKAIAFYCPRCAHTWTIPLDDALNHGAFLRKLDVGRDKP